jgi:hypothetical protein
MGWLVQEEKEEEEEEEEEEDSRAKTICDEFNQTCQVRFPN